MKFMPITFYFYSFSLLQLLLGNLPIRNSELRDDNFFQESALRIPVFFMYTEHYQIMKQDYFI